MGLRHAAKRDDTEPVIVKALELAGWTVVKVSDGGFPDLVCCRRGVVRFLEVKSPGGTLTDAQEKTFRRIEAALVTVHVVRTPEEALLAVGAPMEGVLPPLSTKGHLVTPAYQKAQTAAVVPLKRKR